MTPSLGSEADHRGRLAALRGCAAACGRVRWAATAAATALVAIPLALDLIWLAGQSVARVVVLGQTLAVPVHAVGVVAAGLALLAMPGWWRRSLLAASAVSLIIGAGLMIGDLGGGERPGRTALTVYAANLGLFRGDISANVAEAVRADADVAVFQEVTPDYLEQLRVGLGGRYAEVVAAPRHDALGAAMFARVEVRSSAIRMIDGSPTPSADAVAADGTVVRVIGVHTTPPFFGLPTWQRQHRELAALANEAERVVIAGDFNAIGRLQPMRNLVADAGLRDAHREVGVGLGLTWPDDGLGPVPLPSPVARLDRVLFRGIQPLSLEVRPAAGSDHRALLVRFATE
ncbi:MAG: endonuclease/exonuclease/phosphatase family protein [Microthrixaceae bacterium]